MKGSITAVPVKCETVVRSENKLFKGRRRNFIKIEEFKLFCIFNEISWRIYDKDNKTNLEGSQVCQESKNELKYDTNLAVSDK